MSDRIEVKAEERSVVGKKVKQLRRLNLVPAIVYGQNTQNAVVTLPLQAAEKMWQKAGKRHPVTLKAGATNHLVMVKTIDRDPVKHTLRHIGFQIINKNEAVSAHVPLKLIGIGETPAEKSGLVVAKMLETAEVEALPAKLPDALEVKAETLAAVGDRLIINDITPIAGVKILAEPDTLIAVVQEPVAPASEEEAEETSEEPIADEAPSSTS